MQKDNQSLHFEVFGGTFGGTWKQWRWFLASIWNYLNYLNFAQKTTSLPGCQSDHWGEDLDGGILLSGRWVFFFKQTDLFLVSCSRATPGPLDFLNIYFFGRDDTCHYQQNQQNQQMAVFLVFKGFFQKYVPSSWQKSRLAYAPQEASLLASCSIRENVLCGRPWDSQRRQCVWLLRHLGMPLVATAQLLPNVRDGELYLDRYEQALITSTLSEDGNKKI